MPRRISGVVLLSLVVVSTACGAPSVERVARSVVRVEALPCGQEGVGSGTVVDDQVVVTNAHIVAGSVDDVNVRTWDDRLLPGVVVGFDPERDLAFIRVDGLDVPVASFGEPEQDLAATIIARPGGVERETVDTRVVRLFNATGDDIYGEGDVSRRAIELEADVVPGVSGGGVFSDEGELIGVVFAESRRRENTSYAVDVSEIIGFLQETDQTSPADTLSCR